MEYGLAQVSSVKPIASRHVEVLLAEAARRTERLTEFGRLLGGKGKTATFTVRAEPRFEALPAEGTNRGAAHLPKFLAAEQAIGGKHYGAHSAEQFR